MNRRTPKKDTTGHDLFSQETSPTGPRRDTKTTGKSGRRFSGKGLLMRPTRLVLFVLLLGVSRVEASGLLIPADKSLPPLAMLNHKVALAINDQVSTTRVEQTFR